MEPSSERKKSLSFIYSFMVVASRIKATTRKEKKGSHIRIYSYNELDVVKDLTKPGLREREKILQHLKD